MCFSFTKIKVFFRPYLGCGAESGNKTLRTQKSSLSNLTTKETNYDSIKEAKSYEYKICNCLAHYTLK